MPGRLIGYGTVLTKVFAHKRSKAKQEAATICEPTRCLLAPAETSLCQLPFSTALLEQVASAASKLRLTCSQMKLHFASPWFAQHPRTFLKTCSQVKRFIQIVKLFSFFFSLLNICSTHWICKCMFELLQYKNGLCLEETGQPGISCYGQICEQGHISIFIDPNSLKQGGTVIS